jgi:transaldolase
MRVFCYSLILKAAGMEAYKKLVEEAILWGADRTIPMSRIAQRLCVNFSADLANIGVSGDPL